MGSRAKDALIIFGCIIPIYFGIYAIANQEKALIGATVVMSLGIVTQTYKTSWREPRIWFLVAFISLLNAAAIYELPPMQIKVSLAVAYPLALIEGGGAYLLLRW